jgi:hypothetical protein
MRGRLTTLEPLRPAPDLDKVDRANAAYEQMLKEDPEMAAAIKAAHRSFLRELVYILYTNNRLAKANELLGYLRERYPDYPDAKLPLEEFAMKRLTEEITMLGQDRMNVVLTGLIYQHYLSLALDEDDRALGYERLARQVWTYYDQRISNRRDPLQFPPFEEMKAAILKDALDPNTHLLSPAQIARLRTRLRLPVSAGAETGK